MFVKKKLECVQKKRREGKKEEEEKSNVNFKLFAFNAKTHFKSTYHVLCTEKMEAFELENRNNYCINKNNKSIANSVGLK